MKQLETLSVIEKTMLLSNWQLFRGLATDEVALIAAQSREVEHEPGAIDPEGPSGGSIHFVIEGSIEISQDGEVVRRAGTGEVAGSLAALGVETPVETLEVLEPTRALLLSGADFETAVADHPDFAMAVIRTLVALVRSLGGDTAAREEKS